MRNTLTHRLLLCWLLCFLLFLHPENSRTQLLLSCSALTVLSAAPPAEVFNYTRPPPLNEAAATQWQCNADKAERGAVKRSGAAVLEDSLGVKFPAAPSGRRPLAPLMWSQRGWQARPTAAAVFVFVCHCREVV